MRGVEWGFLPQLLARSDQRRLVGMATGFVNETAAQTHDNGFERFVEQAFEALHFEYGKRARTRRCGSGAQ